ncbi:Alpha_adaptin [Hexamita inflata]|uniref:Alpha adaptin n=1 Tax=Hexamita inflata TaxID=28002 RepID=A0AA86N8F3_9EUKA|nr:Alpha adaptin [Hexamita inflata]CAI9934663.1 Alpha adaptin [Hexamita inflata]CAI9939046.1 Alpha adaptin [Hexamita inflata]
MAFRGLHNFVQEIRVTASHEQEEEIVNAERQKVRTYFSSGSNNSYDSKKYALKMMYMSIMGYKCDFGLVPISQLMASKDKEEKLTGYLVLQQLIKDVPDFLRLVTQTILSDMQSENTFAASLALDFIANDGNAAMAEVLAGPIMNLIQKEPEKVPSVIRKKAILALVQLFKANPDAVQASGAADILMKLMDQKNVGFLTCLMHLFDSLVNVAGFEPIKHRAIYLMQKIIIKREVTDDHIYYTMPCPWLLISIMRFIQKLPCALTEQINPKTSVIESQPVMITQTIQKCFELVSKVGTTGLQSKINIHWAIALEAARLYAYYRDFIQEEIDVKFLFDVIRSNSVASNIKYAAFNCLTLMSPIQQIQFQTKQNLYDIAQAVISEKDYAVRHRGLVLLYNLADQQTASAVCAALCFAAKQSDTPVSYREDAVLRAVQICGNYSKDEWVIGMLLKILPDAQEMKQYSVWKNLANIIQLQMNQNSCAKIMSELKQSCINNQDETKLVEDKLILTIFSFGFTQAFKYLQQQSVQEYIPIIQQAIYLLQSRETAELFAIASTALIFCIGGGYLDVQHLNQLCSSEVIEVQQRACEAYILVQGGQGKNIIQLYEGVVLK